MLLVIAKAVVRLMVVGVCVGLSPLASLLTNLPQLSYIFTTTFNVTKCTTCPAYSKYTKLTPKTLLRKSTVKVSKSTIMAQYNTTTVSINGVNTTINSGDIIKKDGISYMFEWCTYQFERWLNLSREPYFQAQNWEGGMRTADSLVAAR